MAMVFGAPRRMEATYRFAEDLRTLNDYVVHKVFGALELVRRQGPYHPSLHTRKIAGNPDGRFRVMNADDTAAHDIDHEPGHSRVHESPGVGHVELMTHCSVR